MNDQKFNPLAHKSSMASDDLMSARELARDAHTYEGAVLLQREEINSRNAIAEARDDWQVIEGMAA